MMEAIQTNWQVLAAVLVAALLVAWWLLRRASATPERREHRPDVLDEGQAPAQRNQALIDAAPAAQIVPPPVSPALGGLAEIVAVGAQDVVEEARVVAPPSPPVPAPEDEPQPDPSPELPGELPAEPEPAPQHPAPAPAAPEPIVEPPPQPSEPVAVPPPPASTGADDLARIKGLGPKLQALLPTLGITTFAQIAAWTEQDLARIDPQLGPFAGRPAKDNWIEQAKLLAAGDVAGFEDRFGKV